MLICLNEFHDFGGKFTFGNGRDSKLPKLVGSCNGLMLLVDPTSKMSCSGFGLFLWNPFIRAWTTCYYFFNQEMLWEYNCGWSILYWFTQKVQEIMYISMNFSCFLQWDGKLWGLLLHEKYESECEFDAFVKYMNVIRIGGKYTTTILAQESVSSSTMSSLCQLLNIMIIRFLHLDLIWVLTVWLLNCCVFFERLCWWVKTNVMNVKGWNISRLIHPNEYVFCGGIVYWNVSFEKGCLHLSHFGIEKFSVVQVPEHVKGSKDRFDFSLAWRVVCCFFIFNWEELFVDFGKQWRGVYVEAFVFRWILELRSFEVT